VTGIELARPGALLLLLAIPLAAWALARERRRAPRLRHPRAAALARARGGLAARLGWIPGALSVAALALLALALARPQGRELRVEDASVEGIDVVIAFDLSSSMKAADFKPLSRLHVAKEVLKAFVGRRPDDRIGLVVFAGEAYTRAPLTLDSGLLRELVDGLRFGAIDDGTAIGNAIATAVNRLRESDAKSKAVVLITDGDNNAGQVSPLEAAGMARALGIRVFPILVGKGGVVPYPIGTDVFGQPIYEQREFPVNPALLERIAAETGGAFAVATDREGLESGLQAALDRMEKSRLFEPGGLTRRSERFRPLLGGAFALGALGLALGATRLRSFP